jgi:hypothetical protein
MVVSGVVACGRLAAMLTLRPRSAAGAARLIGELKRYNRPGPTRGLAQAGAVEKYTLSSTTTTIQANMAAHSAPFAIRCAELHHGLDLDPAGAAWQQEVRDIVAHAAAAELTHMIIGEAWPRGLARLVRYDNTPGLQGLVDRDAVTARRERFAAITAAATAAGLTVWGNINPVFYPDGFLEAHPDAEAAAPPHPDRCTPTRGLQTPKPPLCLQHPAVRALLQSQARELLALPDVDGLSSWLNMSDALVFACSCTRCGELGLAGTIAEYANLVHTVCAEADKTCNVRTYLGSWQCGLETAVFLEAAPAIASDVHITYKQQQGDMYNGHPLNPLLGRLSPHPELIEFDTYGEYRGQSLGIVCSVRRQLQARMQAAAASGVAGVVLRGLHHRHRFAIDHELFSALAADPELDCDQWCRTWLGARFGAANAHTVLQVLDGSWEACQRAMYVRNVNWASWSIPDTLDRLCFILYDRSASTIPGAFDRLQVTDDLLAEVAACHADAIAHAAACRTACRKLDATMADADRAALTAAADVLHAYCSLVHPFMQMVLRALQWRRLESPTMREFRRPALLAAVAATEDAIAAATAAFAAVNSAALAPLMGPVELLPVPPEERLLPPLRNAATICAEVRALADVAPTSFTGLFPWPGAWPAAAGTTMFGERCTGD